MPQDKCKDMLMMTVIIAVMIGLATACAYTTWYLTIEGACQRTCVLILSLFATIPTSVFVLFAFTHGIKNCDKRYGTYDTQDTTESVPKYYYGTV